jgi:glutamate racemase
MSAAPIGVFDSGVGGLCVLRAIRDELPHEHLAYVADSAHVPYGNKPPAFIEQRALAIAKFLLAQDAKAIVVACNTATSAAIAVLRARFSIPIIGMEPALKPAIAQTRAGVVGVLATAGTAASGKFANLLARFAGRAQVLVQPCPGFVEAVERGELTTPSTRALIAETIEPLLQRGADTLVLGCTHYPFLRPVIQEIAGPGVTIVDPSAAVARELRRRLAEANILSAGIREGAQNFWSSAAISNAQPLMSQLWGRPVVVSSLGIG